MRRRWRSLTASRASPCTPLGELHAARVALEASLRHEPVSHRSRTLHLGFDYYDWAGMALGRTLWMLGDPEGAIARVRATVDNAERLDHPVTLSIVLHWAAAVYLWVGDLDEAARHIEWFLSRAETHSLGPYLAVGRGLKGELAIRRGDPALGVELLSTSLERLHAAHYELVSTAFSLALAQGLADLGRHSEGLAVIESALRAVDANGDLCFVPELLRVKARLLISSDPAAAAACLKESLDWAQRQGAKGWEQRAAADLAALSAAGG